VVIFREMKSLPEVISSVRGLFLVVVASMPFQNLKAQLKV
jgi:hypothetical protein